MNGAELTWLMANVGPIGVGLSLAVLVSLTALLTAILLATLGEM